MGGWGHQAFVHPNTNWLGISKQKIVLQVEKGREGETSPTIGTCYQGGIRYQTGSVGRHLGKIPQQIAYTDHAHFTDVAKMRAALYGMVLMGQIPYHHQLFQAGQKEQESDSGEEWHKSEYQLPCTAHTTQTL